MNSSEIITGEKLQNIANIYIGEQSDFNYNPFKEDFSIIKA